MLMNSIMPSVKTMMSALVPPPPSCANDSEMTPMKSANTSVGAKTKSKSKKVVDQAFKEELTAYYAVHNPEKLQHVETIVRRFDKKVG